MEKLPQTQTARKRRELLEDALLELMRIKGYAQTTVTDLCRVAGIPRRTFYHYFDCKEAVVQALVEDMLTKCDLEVMLELNCGFDAMKESLIRNFRYWQGPARHKLDLLLDNGLSGEIMRCALHWLEKEGFGLHRRLAFSEKRTQIAAMVGASGFFTLLMYWRFNQYRETPEEMAEYAVWILSEPLYPV